MEIQGEHKEREDYLKQKMKQPEEDNGGFNILISFYFNIIERHGGPTGSGILQPGAVFPQASSVTSDKFLYERTVSVQYKLKCFPKCKIW